jgi:TonB family protein
MMRASTHIAVVSVVAGLLTARSVAGQTQTTNDAALASAKTIYFEDKSGVDAVGQKAQGELARWGKFQIVADRKKADLIVVLSRDPDQGDNLLLAGGQTASIDSTGHVSEDLVPNYNKQAAVSYALLSVMDAKSGKFIWSNSHRWGGLLTGFNTAGEDLIKELEKEVQNAERAANLRILKSVNPTFPPEASKAHVYGKVVVRIELDRNGRVVNAKATYGPSELVKASEDAARKWLFEPPSEAPVVTNLEMAYGYAPAPCPPGKKANHGEVSYTEKLPLNSGHTGELKIVGDISVPLPPYPEEAREAGTQGKLELFITVTPKGEVIGVRVVNSLDPAIDDVAVATVRTWKFKVSRGETVGFPVSFFYQMT